MATEMPKIGDRIPTENFHVSELNVNYGEPFGEDEKDKALIGHLARGEIVEPFTARPEGEGYGVVKGRRRFLARRESVKEFVVGTDCIIKEMTDEQSLEASWLENLDTFRKGMNPVRRAIALNKRISFSTSSMRAMARRWNIPTSTLWEWIKILDLNAKMRDVVAKELITFSDGLAVAKMKLGEDLQHKLAEAVETEGLEAFKKELARLTAGKMKRGIPKDVYEIDRIVWDKRNRKLMGYYEVIEKAAKAKGFEKIPEYEQDFLIRHIDEIKREGEPA